jgi:hypothetical protein
MAKGASCQENIKYLIYQNDAPWQTHLNPNQIVIRLESETRRRFAAPKSNGLP